MSGFVMMEQVDEFLLFCKKCECESFPEIRKNGPHLSAYCSSCDNWIKHAPKNEVIGEDLHWQDLVEN